jgi:hypothetical protein
MKSHLWGARLFLFALCFSSTLCYLNFPLGYNQTIYHYMGTVLRDGGVPYRDFVDRKGPVGLLFYGLAAVLFGDSDRAYRFFDLLVLSGIGIGLYGFARKSFSSLMAFGGVALWFTHTLLDGPGNTGDVTNLIVLGVLVIAVLLETPNRVRLLAAGFVTAAMGWVKPTAWLIAGPVLVYALVFAKNARQSVRKSLALVTSGFVLFSGLIIACLYFMHALTHFYEAVVLDPILAYVPKTHFSVGHNVRGFLKWLLADPVFRIGGLVGLFWGKPGTSTHVIARLAVIGGFVAVFAESRFWPYHFTPVLPFLAFGVLAGLQRFQATNHSSRIKIGIVAGAIFLLLFSPVRLMAKDLRIIFSSAPNSEKRAELFALADLAKLYRDRLQVLQTLRPLLRSEDTIYLYGSDPGIYLALQKRTACRHANPGDLLYDYTGENSPSHRQRWRTEILAFIQESQPDWLVVDQNLWAHTDTAVKQFITQMLQKSYESPIRVASYLLYHKAPETL